MTSYDYDVFKDPRDKRLAKEHELIDELCNRSSKISYEITKQFKGVPPEGYKIIYDNVKSIVGINQNSSPIYGTHHEAEIIFPPAYPGADGAPKCRMLTDIWHPNVRSKDPAKGRICINAKALGAWHTLDMLAMHIGEMLQYKNYHAVNEEPWPEDPEVARWVREYAEPNGIVNKNKKIFVDHSELLDPEKPGQRKADRDEVNTANDNDGISFWKKRLNMDLGGMDGDDLDMSFSKRKKTTAADDDLDFDFQVRRR
ncbi:MAG: hypothetical protein JSV88_21380 [Candidatus Aminicenantes bacterium]|nr:MAG: hypothetical protein JSV88_21380 [Candidatus Aminicenantes bacterium]